PKFVPKNFLKTAPVYPSKALISNFRRIKILDRSMGLNIVAINENLSSGYCSKMIRDNKNNPSKITARNNHIRTAYPNPLILFSLTNAILKAKAVKIKVRKAPVVSNKVKFQIASLKNNPYNTNGIPNPKTRLSVREMATPKYWPKKIVE